MGCYKIWIMGSLHLCEMSFLPMSMTSVKGEPLMGHIIVTAIGLVCYNLDYRYWVGHQNVSCSLGR